MSWINVLPYKKPYKLGFLKTPENWQEILDLTDEVNWEIYGDDLHNGQMIDPLDFACLGYNYALRDMSELTGRDFIKWQRELKL